MVDIDGVCLRGTDPVSGSAAALRGAVAGGDVVTYMTNNAMRRAGDVAALLAYRGFPVTEGAVLTSAMAVAGRLVRLLPRGAPVLVVGEQALWEAVRDAGFSTKDRGPAAALVVGNTKRFDYEMLRRASDVVREGALFIASNTDSTYPTTEGLVPGAGSLVAAIATASGGKPEVAGKPGRALAAIASRRSQGLPVVLVGDRPETDIAMGRRMRWRTVLVLTGVCTPFGLASARLLPDLLMEDLAEALDLGLPERLVVVDGCARAAAGQSVWTAQIDGPRVRVRGEGACRLLVAEAAWRDAGRTRPLRVPADLRPLSPTRLAPSP